MVYCLVSFLSYMLASISAQINGKKNILFLSRTGFNQLHKSLLPLFNIHVEQHVNLHLLSALRVIFARYFFKGELLQKDSSELNVCPTDGHQGMCKCSYIRQASQSKTSQHQTSNTTRNFSLRRVFQKSLCDMTFSAEHHTSEGHGLEKT